MSNYEEQKAVAKAVNPLREQATLDVTRLLARSVVGVDYYEVDGAEEENINSAIFTTDNVPNSPSFGFTIHDGVQNYSFHVEVVGPVLEDD